MVHSIGRTAMAQVQSLLCGFLQDGAFPFSAVLTVQDIVDLISQTCVETCDRIFTPVVTLCTFLSQIHSDDPSCRAAVARLNATRVTQGLEPCSPLTGGYCKARQRLAESLLYRLVSLSGQRLQQQTPRAWHGHGDGRSRSWRLGGLHAGHGGQSTGVSPAWQPEAGAGLSCRSPRGRVLVGLWRGLGSGRRAEQGP